MKFYIGHKDLSNAKQTEVTEKNLMLEGTSKNNSLSWKGRGLLASVFISDLAQNGNGS